MINMQNFLIGFVTFAMAVGMAKSFDFNEGDLASELALWKLYERWQAYHNIYRSIEEKHGRFGTFKANAVHVHEVNNMDKPYKLHLNHFADITDEEYRTIYGSNIGNPQGVTEFMYQGVGDLPAWVDWRRQGAVTGVKNQRRCGCCWAFAAVAATEGLNQIKTKQLVELSEQEILDCSTGSRGCFGGLMEYAYNFMMRNGGIATEYVYPYLGFRGICSFRKLSSRAVAISGYQMVPTNDENELMRAVANQPVAVGIAASSLDFRFYSHGVFNGLCGTQLNHAVTIVGYGEENDGTKYWILKNSWGLTWGEQGYMRIQRGISNAEGQCGIAMYASYPV